MKKTVSIILNILSLLSMFFSILWTFVMSLLLFRCLLYPVKFSVQKDSLTNGIFYRFVAAYPISFCLIGIIAFLGQLVVSFGVLKRFKWGLYGVRIILFLFLIADIIYDYSNLTYIDINIGLIVFLLIFFYLPIVKSLFEKQPPIPSEPTPSFPPPASAG